MKNASEVEIFPYTSNLVCYILVDGDKVEQVYHHRKSDLPFVEEVYNKVKNGEACLYAVWPENYRSDLFKIDDIELFAKKFGII
jgi:hypothetical protein